MVAAEARRNGTRGRRLKRPRVRRDCAPAAAGIARRLARGAGAAWLVACLATPDRLAAQDVAGPEGPLATAPVELDGIELFRVRGVSSLPAAERARLVREQIRAAAADPELSADDLRVVEIDGATRIEADGRAIFTLVDADARMEQLELNALASAHLFRIRQAILSYRADRTAEAVGRGVTRALAATLAFGIATLVLLSLTRRLERALDRRLRAQGDPTTAQSLRVLRAARVADALKGALAALRALALLAMAVVFVGFVLAQFPWTRGLSRNVLAFATRPLAVIGAGIVNSIPSLIFLAVLFVVLRLLLRLVRLFFLAVEKGGFRIANFDPEWAQPTYKIVRVAVIAFGLIVAYPYIPGSQSAAFRGISLFAGVLFSLGSSSAIANIIAGYTLIYRRAFRLGDRIRVGDSVGDVIRTRLQVTHLRSVKNEEIIIPNSHILGADVINYSSLSREHGLILHTEVAIGYDTSWRQVEALLVMAAERTDGLGTVPRPFVHEKALGDFAVKYELNVYCTNVPSMHRLYAALHRSILDVFNEYGVQIMTPVYEGDPPQPKVVPPSAWYAPPAAGPSPSRDGSSAATVSARLRNDARGL